MARKPRLNSVPGTNYWMDNELIRGASNLFRSIYSIWVVNNGGLVLHAGGILRYGKAYVFFGPSNSGKSTITQLSKDASILDDESIFIHRFNGGYLASGRRLRRSFPIHGLYKLTKDKQVYLRKLPKSWALGELFTVPAWLGGLAGQQRLLVNFSNLVKKIPCFELHFRRDDSFWRCIDAN